MEIDPAGAPPGSPLADGVADRTVPPHDALAAPPDSPFDDARFRQVLGHFGTGVTVVTAVDRGEPIGFTAQSFTSVSLDPPLISVCPSRRSVTWPRMERAGAFCANVLASDQEEAARAFAIRDADRFASVGWVPAPVTGSPVLSGVLAWVDCRVQAVHQAGDHLIVVGSVVGLGLGTDDGGRTPLLFYRGGYGRFES
ncbi:MAG TPA: flavin reductase family protein [Acidimicrobiales bacterium]|nr:flavin reductase family protein [Acidimicrobiales bacterium]